MMKRHRPSVLAIAVLALGLLQAVPAHAADAGFSLTPGSGPAGTTITVKSSVACSTPPAGSTLKDVIVVVTDRPSRLIIAVKALTPTAERTWSGSMPLASGIRNGAYFVKAACETTATDSDPVYMTYDTLEFDVTSPAGKSDPAVRIAGSDRVMTAIAASQDIYKVSPGVTSLVLSRADSYADALAGTPLASYVGGPLLLTGGATLDARTEAEIKRVLTPNGTVYVLGGTAAISDGIATTLTLSGYTVTRLAGANRYDTAVKIAEQGIEAPTTLMLATGTDFGDGLVAGTAAPWADADAGRNGGGAVLLTAGKVMPTETKAYLASHAAVRRYAVGALAAGADPTATPIVGTDPADTSRKVAAQFFPANASVAVASLTSFPDALSGGAHAVAFGAPLLLTAAGSLPASVATYLKAERANIVVVYVYGGTAVVTEAVRARIVQAIS